MKINEINKYKFYCNKIWKVVQMKQRDPELAKGWVQIVHTLDISTAMEKK